MPTFKKSKGIKGTFSENELQVAVCEVQSGRGSVSGIARTHQINRTALARYVRETKVNGERKVLKKSMKTKQIQCRMFQVFTDEEEVSLAEYAKKGAKMFFGLTKKGLRGLAYDFALEKQKAYPVSWDEKQMAGEDWLRGFRARRQAISLRQPEPTSIARAMAFNTHNVNQFFDNLEELYGRSEIAPSNIWNLDETGLSTVQKPKQVFAERGAHQVGQVTSAERGSTVTMCACVNALGQVLPPAYLFPRVNFKHNMLKGAPTMSAGFANKSGWMTKEVFPAVLRHFAKFVNLSAGTTTLLILDNHTSHITPLTLLQRMLLLAEF